MYDRLSEMADQYGLLILGALHPARQQVQMLSDGTLLLLGTGPSFWPIFQRSFEARDGQSDPVDRWSARVLDKLAKELGATPYFPFGGPPYKPFINWALTSGRAFQSPAGPMVHDKMGMMISFRGALHLDAEIDFPPPPLTASPCSTCAEKPCLKACPVGALNESGVYDVPACYAHLNTSAGEDCMKLGCRARRACPISQNSGRTAEQTSHHMRYFRKT
ncbi:MAG: ferredoxin [Paracoccaceae bacterium]